jgi:hypothetical protein
MHKIDFFSILFHILFYIQFIFVEYNFHNICFFVECALGYVNRIVAFDLPVYEFFVSLVLRKSSYVVIIQELDDIIIFFL